MITVQSLMRQSNDETSDVERADSLVINHSRQSLFASALPFLSLNQQQLDSRQESRFARTIGRSRDCRETTASASHSSQPHKSRRHACDVLLENSRVRTTARSPSWRGILRGIQPRGFETQSGYVVSLHGLVNMSGALDCSFAVEIRGQTDAQLIIDIN